MLLLIKYRFEKDGKHRNHVANCSTIDYAMLQVKMLVEDMETDFPEQVEKLGQIIIDGAYFITEEQKLPEIWSHN